MKKNYTERSKYLKYFLFLYILAISSFEYFFRASNEATYLLFPFVAFGFYYYNKKINVLFIKIILAFLVAFFLQSILYGSPIYFVITLFFRFLTIYFSVSIIGKNFVKIFIQTIKIFSIISLIFYGLQHFNFILNFLLSFSENFTNLNSDISILADRPNFIIYTIQTLTQDNSTFYRNSGPFFEPGLFAVFLNIVLALNLAKSRSVFNKTNILFIVVLITTFSTMGYIVLFMNLTLFGIYSKSIKLKYRILLVCLLVLSIPTLISISFIGDKMQDQFNDSDVSYSRFGAAVVHWNIIKDYPITGLPYDETTYSKYADNISPNGITEIFLRFGVIAGFIYYVFLFKASSKMIKMFGNKKKGLGLFLVLTPVLFSETQGNKPIYWAIIFSQIPLSNYLIKWKIFQRNKHLI